MLKKDESKGNMIYCMQIIPKFFQKKYYIWRDLSRFFWPLMKYTHLRPLYGRLYHEGRVCCIFRNFSIKIFYYNLIINLLYFYIYIFKFLKTLTVNIVRAVTFIT